MDDCESRLRTSAAVLATLGTLGAAQLGPSPPTAPRRRAPRAPARLVAVAGGCGALQGGQDHVDAQVDAVDEAAVGAGHVVRAACVAGEGWARAWQQRVGVVCPGHGVRITCT